MSWTLEKVNALPTAEFNRIFSPIYERSPWIAERAEKQRPFASVEQMQTTLQEIVAAASDDLKMQLIRAHPDLVGRAVLTAESQGEQAAAGLMNLSKEEVAQFDQSNRAYKERFGFPFIICARMNRKEAILQAFPARLQNELAVEIKTALEEIDKIAWLRLTDLVSE
ncbi:MAG: 2-oxo-4-hydroxy-4-carboxy-5-ureidoimidazoline decarboxylase [Chthoniobacteraceae bacterium]